MTTSAKKPAAKPAAKTPARTAAAKPAAKAPVRRAAAAKPAAKPATKPAPAAKAAPAKEAKKPYKMLTGIDDSEFCSKVSAHLKDGYELYGSPTMTFNGKNVIVGQAVVLKKAAKKSGKKKK
jgi:hypothetical protein